MGKFLRSLTDGSLRCRYCGEKECNCMEDGRTKICIISVNRETDKAWLIHLRMQTLPNGKRIPSGSEVWFPKKSVYGIDAVLKTVLVENSFINKLVFD